MSHTNSRWMTAGILAGLLCFAPSAFTQKPDRAEVQFEAASKKELVDGDLKAAIGLYSKLVQSTNRAIAAKALIQMGQCQEKLGQADARKSYERTIRDFADQKEAVATAHVHLDKMAGSAEKGIVAREASGMQNNRAFGSAISRDGRYLAFTNNGNLGIYDVSAGTARGVATKASPDAGLYNPLISPDGKYIAYQRVGSPDVNGLYVIGSDGANPRRLAGGKDLTAIPWDWAPDGRHVLAVFRSSGKAPQCALVSVADGSFRIVASQAGAGRIAPDGRHIAFVRGRPSDAQVFMVSVEDGKEVMLVRGQYGAPLWTPDGKRLLVVRDRQGQLDLWAIPVVNGEAGGPPEFVKDNVQPLLGATGDGQYYYQLRT
jgi:Tol biopolymer transport system component